MDAMADESQTNATNPTPPATAGSFDAFVGPHLPVLLRVAGSLCRNTHDAEDLVQDTLIRAFIALVEDAGPSISILVPHELLYRAALVAGDDDAVLDPAREHFVDGVLERGLTGDGEERLVGVLGEREQATPASGRQEHDASRRASHRSAFGHGDCNAGSMPERRSPRQGAASASGGSGMAVLLCARRAVSFRQGAP